MAFFRYDKIKEREITMNTPGHKLMPFPLPLGDGSSEMCHVIYSGNAANKHGGSKRRP